MSREWKPGDVAMVTFSNGSEAVAILTDRGDLDSLWIAGGQRDFARNGDVTARPLVVIDPEDAEQLIAVGKVLGWPDADRFRAALRSLITPPRPPEPTGLGAVVEDEAGVRWVRIARGRYGWVRADNMTQFDCRDDELNSYPGNLYADIAAATVLNEGVQS